MPISRKISDSSWTWSAFHIDRRLDEPLEFEVTSGGTKPLMANGIATVTREQKVSPDETAEEIRNLLLNDDQ
ncbi:MAG: hypothetical protein ABEL51_15565 [Salinibacter sp.]